MGWTNSLVKTQQESERVATAYQGCRWLETKSKAPAFVCCWAIAATAANKGTYSSLVPTSECLLQAIHAQVNENKMAFYRCLMYLLT